MENREAEYYLQASVLKSWVCDCDSTHKKNSKIKVVKYLRCIYFLRHDLCYVTSPTGGYEPSENERKKYCENDDFSKCPRFVAGHKQ